jgi:UDP-N-acetylmuramoyl-tripeptide--D-alanyl-D-alanine ligase
MSPPAFTYAELLETTGGTTAGVLRPFERARLWTDTRTLAAGDFFLPLSGERFDGHDYLEPAIAAGATGAFVQRDKRAAHPEWEKLPNLIAVDSPVDAYLALAGRHRQAIDPLVIAVTGSSGKTTTKEMLYAVFSPLRKTMKTERNFNNEVGVSQTLLSLTPDTEALIVEMGMRGLRQIAPLARAARPDAALVINVGPAHIGLLGSLENIAEAKLEIAEGLDPETGVLVINGDDPHLSALAPQRWTGRLESYRLADAEGIAPFAEGEGKNAVEGVRFRYRDCPIRLPVPGLHMVSNALGVLKLGESLGFPPEDLARGLSAFSPPDGRGERRPLKGFPGVQVVNDAYNANPDSAKASLQAFLQTFTVPGARRDAKPVLVLGGMKELGDFSEEYHRALGRWLAEQPGIAALFTVGEEAGWLAEAARPTADYPVFHAADVEAVATRLLAEEVPLKDTVLYLKGSRAYRLEELPDCLTRMAQASSPAVSPAGG